MNNSKRKLGLIFCLLGIFIMLFSICLTIGLGVIIARSTSDDVKQLAPLISLPALLSVPICISLVSIGIFIAKKESSNSWEATYKGHKIRVKNEGINEKLFIDGELQDSKQGLKIRSQLQGRIKNEAGEDELVEAKLGGFWKVGCQLSVNKVPIQVTES